MLAERANLSANYVGEIERGAVQASLRSLIGISQALQVNPSELFVYIDKRPTKSEIIRKVKDLLELL